MMKHTLRWHGFGETRKPVPLANGESQNRASLQGVSVSQRTRISSC